MWLARENLGWDVHGMLTEKHGFECSPKSVSDDSPDGNPADLFRWVDDEHGISMGLDPWNDDIVGGSTSCRIHPGIGRRDINELQLLLLPSPFINSSSVSTVIATHKVLLGGCQISFDERSITTGELEAAVDRLVERMVSCANLASIQEYLDIDPGSDILFKQILARPRLLNRCLWGWREQDEALFEPYLEEIAESSPEHAAKVQADVDRVRAWIKKPKWYRTSPCW